jgi:hypothetical protein
MSVPWQKNTEKDSFTKIKNIKIKNKEMIYV